MNENLNLVTIKNLNFGYKKKELLLQNINFEIPKASIFGFIGHNGAGKTTTMRILLGLLQPQSGTVSIFGKSLATHRENILNRIGSLIESPSVYKHLSGYGNLKVACQYLDIPFSKIDEVLEIVQLTEHAKKISKKYSTGMKQRLGLAMALLRDPELLILDEPTNGLDPLGIQDFRKLIIQLNQAGKTIFLSSHLLSEVEKMATHIGIIQNGSFQFKGTIEELENLKKSNFTVLIKLSDSIAVQQLVKENIPIKIINSELISCSVNNRNQLAALIEKIVHHQIKIYEVIPQKNDLEEIFLNIKS